MYYRRLLLTGLLAAALCNIAQAQDTTGELRVYVSTKDGRRLDVSDRAVGTSYIITDASVAELRKDGTLYAANVRNTTFGATLFGLGASCDVEVVSNRAANS